MAAAAPAEDDIDISKEVSSTLDSSTLQSGFLECIYSHDDEESSALQEAVRTKFPAEGVPLEYGDVIKKISVIFEGNKPMLKAARAWLNEFLEQRPYSLNGREVIQPVFAVASKTAAKGASSVDINDCPDSFQKGRSVRIGNDTYEISAVSGKTITLTPPLQSEVEVNQQLFSQPDCIDVRFKHLEKKEFAVMETHSVDLKKRMLSFEDEQLFLAHRLVLLALRSGRSYAVAGSYFTSSVLVPPDALVDYDESAMPRDAVLEAKRRFALTGEGVMRCKIDPFLTSPRDGFDDAVRILEKSVLDASCDLYSRQVARYALAVASTAESETNPRQRIPYDPDLVTTDQVNCEYYDKIPLEAIETLPFKGETIYLLKENIPLYERALLTDNTAAAKIKLYEVTSVKKFGSVPMALFDDEYCTSTEIEEKQLTKDRIKELKFVSLPEASATDAEMVETWQIGRRAIEKIKRNKYMITAPDFKRPRTGVSYEKDRYVVYNEKLQRITYTTPTRMGVSKLVKLPEERSSNSLPIRLAIHESVRQRRGVAEIKKIFLGNARIHVTHAWETCKPFTPGDVVRIDNAYHCITETSAVKTDSALLKCTMHPPVQSEVGAEMAHTSFTMRYAQLVWPEHVKSVTFFAASKKVINGVIEGGKTFEVKVNKINAYGILKMDLAPNSNLLVCRHKTGLSFGRIGTKSKLKNVKILNLKDAVALDDNCVLLAFKTEFSVYNISENAVEELNRNSDATANPTSLALHPSGTIVIAHYKDTDLIRAYSLQKDGSDVTLSELVTISDVKLFALSPSGNVLVVLSKTNNFVDCYNFTDGFEPNVDRHSFNVDKSTTEIHCIDDDTIVVHRGVIEVWNLSEGVCIHTSLREARLMSVNHLKKIVYGVFNNFLWKRDPYVFEQTQEKVQEGARVLYTTCCADSLLSGRPNKDYNLQNLGITTTSFRNGQGALVTEVNRSLLYDDALDAGSVILSVGGTSLGSMDAADIQEMKVEPWSVMTVMNPLSGDSKTLPPITASRGGNNILDMTLQRLFSEPFKEKDVLFINGDLTTPFTIQTVTIQETTDDRVVQRATVKPEFTFGARTTFVERLGQPQKSEGTLTEIRIDDVGSTLPDLTIVDDATGARLTMSGQDSRKLEETFESEYVLDNCSPTITEIKERNTFGVEEADRVLELSKELLSHYSANEVMGKIVTGNSREFQVVRQCIHHAVYNRLGQDDDHSRNAKQYFKAMKGEDVFRLDKESTIRPTSTLEPTEDDVEDDEEYDDDEKDDDGNSAASFTYMNIEERPVQKVAWGVRCTYNQTLGDVFKEANSKLRKDHKLKVSLSPGDSCLLTYVKVASTPKVDKTSGFVILINGVEYKSQESNRDDLTLSNWIKEGSSDPIELKFSQFTENTLSFEKSHTETCQHTFTFTLCQIDELDDELVVSVDTCSIVADIPILQITSFGTALKKDTKTIELNNTIDKDVGRVLLLNEDMTSAKMLIAERYDTVTNKIYYTDSSVNTSYKFLVPSVSPTETKIELKCVIPLTAISFKNADVTYVMTKDVANVYWAHLTRKAKMLKAFPPTERCTVTIKKKGVQLGPSFNVWKFKNSDKCLNEIIRERVQMSNYLNYFINWGNNTVQEIKPNKSVVSVVLKSQARQTQPVNSTAYYYLCPFVDPSDPSLADLTDDFRRKFVAESPLVLPSIDTHKTAVRKGKSFVDGASTSTQSLEGSFSREGSLLVAQPKKAMNSVLNTLPKEPTDDPMMNKWKVGPGVKLNVLNKNNFAGLKLSDKIHRDDRDVAIHSWFEALVHVPKTSVVAKLQHPRGASRFSATVKNLRLDGMTVEVDNVAGAEIHTTVTVHSEGGTFIEAEIENINPNDMTLKLSTKIDDTATAVRQPPFAAKVKSVIESTLTVDNLRNADADDMRVTVYCKDGTSAQRNVTLINADASTVTLNEKTVADPIMVCESDFTGATDQPFFVHSKYNGYNADEAPDFTFPFFKTSAVETAEFVSFDYTDKHPGVGTMHEDSAFVRKHKDSEQKEEESTILVSRSLFIESELHPNTVHSPVLSEIDKFPNNDETGVLTCGGMLPNGVPITCVVTAMPTKIERYCSKSMFKHDPDSGTWLFTDEDGTKMCVSHINGKPVHTQLDNLLVTKTLPKATIGVNENSELLYDNETYPWIDIGTLLAFYDTAEEGYVIRMVMGVNEEGRIAQLDAQLTHTDIEECYLALQVITESNEKYVLWKGEKALVETEDAYIFDELSYKNRVTLTVCYNTALVTGTYEAETNTFTYVVNSKRENEHGKPDQYYLCPADEHRIISSRSLDSAIKRDDNLLGDGTWTLGTFEYDGRLYVPETILKLLTSKLAKKQKKFKVERISDHPNYGTFKHQGQSYCVALGEKAKDDASQITFEKGTYNFEKIIQLTCAGKWPTHEVCNKQALHEPVTALFLQAQARRMTKGTISWNSITVRNFVRNKLAGNVYVGPTLEWKGEMLYTRDKVQITDSKLSYVKGYDRRQKLKVTSFKTQIDSKFLMKRSTKMPFLAYEVQGTLTLGDNQYHFPLNCMICGKLDNKYATYLTGKYAYNQFYTPENLVQVEEVDAATKTAEVLTPYRDPDMTTLSLDDLRFVYVTESLAQLNGCNAGVINCRSVWGLEPDDSKVYAVNLIHEYFSRRVYGDTEYGVSTFIMTMIKDLFQSLRHCGHILERDVLGLTFDEVEAFLGEKYLKVYGEKAKKERQLLFRHSVAICLNDLVNEGTLHFKDDNRYTRPAVDSTGHSCYRDGKQYWSPEPIETNLFTDVGVHTELYRNVRVGASVTFTGAVVHHALGAGKVAHKFGADASVQYRSYLVGSAFSISGKQFTEKQILWAGDAMNSKKVTIDVGGLAMLCDERQRSLNAGDSSEAYVTLNIELHDKFEVPEVKSHSSVWSDNVVQQPPDLAWGVAAVFSALNSKIFYNLILITDKKGNVTTLTKVEWTARIQLLCNKAGVDCLSKKKMGKILQNNCALQSYFKTNSDKTIRLYETTKIIEDPPSQADRGVKLEEISATWNGSGLTKFNRTRPPFLYGHLNILHVLYNPGRVQTVDTTTGKFFYKGADNANIWMRNFTNVSKLEIFVVRHVPPEGQRKYVLSKTNRFFYLMFKTYVTYNGRNRAELIWSKEPFKGGLEPDPNNVLIGYECGVQGFTEAARVLNEVVKKTLQGKVFMEHKKQLVEDFKGVFLMTGAKEEVRLDEDVLQYKNVPFEADDELRLYVIAPP